MLAGVRKAVGLIAAFADWSDYLEGWQCCPIRRKGKLRKWCSREAFSPFQRDHVRNGNPHKREIAVSLI